MRDDMLNQPFGWGELITNGLQAGRVVGRSGDMTNLRMVKMWGNIHSPVPSVQVFTRTALMAWRVAVSDWTEFLADGAVVEEKFELTEDSSGVKVLRRFTRPVSVTVAVAEKPSELRGTHTRWTRERNGTALSADILSDVEIIVATDTGRVITGIPGRPMRPDEARMIGVRLIEAATLADGERTFRDRT